MSIQDSALSAETKEYFTLVEMFVNKLIDRDEFKARVRATGRPTVVPPDPVVYCSCCQVDETSGCSQD